MFDVGNFQGLRKGNFAKEFYYFETLESTMLGAAELAAQGVAEGCVVLANQQTAGRGRKDRTWFSPGDLNLYFSVVLRPPTPLLHFIPFLASLALHRALQGLAIEADLKWPNDVLVGRKKIAGILMQTSVEQEVLHHAILGIGINVNVRSFPAELAPVATSIALETGAPAARESVLASILLEFERPYEKISELGWRDLSADLERRSTYLRSCPVRVRENGRVLEGITAGLDEYGGLIVETETGRQIVYAGDVESCRKE